MYINPNTVVMAASVISALAVIFSAVFAVYRWYLRQNQQDKEIENIKVEQCLLIDMFLDPADCFRNRAVASLFLQPFQTG